MFLPSIEALWLLYISSFPWRPIQKDNPYIEFFPNQEKQGENSTTKLNSTIIFQSTTTNLLSHTCTHLPTQPSAKAVAATNQNLNLVHNSRSKLEDKERNGNKTMYHYHQTLNQIGRIYKQCSRERIHKMHCLNVGTLMFFLFVSSWKKTSLAAPD